MSVFKMICMLLRAVLSNRARLAAENLALRQQLAILQRFCRRPRLRQRDRIFWAWLSRLWEGWQSVLLIVKPETVIRWHRQDFKLYWRWKSRKTGTGRPRITGEIRHLIRCMSKQNATWGAPRAAGTSRACRRRPSRPGHAWSSTAGGSSWTWPGRPGSCGRASCSGWPGGGAIRPGAARPGLGAGCPRPPTLTSALCCASDPHDNSAFQAPLRPMG